VQKFISLAYQVKQFSYEELRMSNMAKQKGKRGERDLSTLLGELLYLKETQALPPWAKVFVDPQAHGGDIVSIPGLSIECKRQELLRVDYWWAQTLRQADNLGAVPVLAYRQNRKPWVFCLPADLLGIVSEGYLTINEEVFGAWLRHWVGTI
jgi:Holliday junction resolvase